MQCVAVVTGARQTALALVVASASEHPLAEQEGNRATQPSRCRADLQG